MTLCVVLCLCGSFLLGYAIGAAVDRADERAAAERRAWAADREAQHQRIVDAVNRGVYNQTGR